MRYIKDKSGFLLFVSFGADIECEGATCTEYKGTVPSGYVSLGSWAAIHQDRLYQWYIDSNGNLARDTSKTAPADLPLPIKAGGTGGATAADARKNLGLGTTRLTTQGAILDATTTTYTFNAGGYNFLLVLGRPGANTARDMTMVIPCASLGTSADNWRLADAENYVDFKTVMDADKNVTMTYVGSSGGGYISSVRGVN